MKIVKIIIIALFSLLLLSAMVVYFFLRSTIPPWDGVLTGCAILNPVEIERNAHGVPVIKATGDDDLYFAIGFVHAQDRLFQMDMQRRAATGRLAEVLGEQALAGDIRQHRLLAGAGIEKSLRALKPELVKALEHYCRGVNHFISGQNLPPEFHALRYAPAEWQVRDVLAVMKYLEGELAASGGELNHARWLLAQPAARTRGWLASPRPGFEASRRAWAKALADPVLRPQLDAESEALALGPAGSAWVVAGRRTRSKAPLLVNDFSWAPQLPALFYQVAGRTPAREISGNTLPGIPFLFSGHNRHVGWGISPARSDTLDCFLLERHPRDPRLYRCDGRWLELRFGEQRIRCRGRGDIALRVAASLFGPVIEAGGELLAVRSTVQNRTLALDALYRMNLAHGLKDFAAALPRFTAPVLSVVYCDRRGNIGAARVGLEPRRGRGDGLLPLRAEALADGWKDLRETGVSAVEDPGRGWLADFDLDERTPAARAFFKFDPAADPRRRRLGELLDAAVLLDAAAAARLQNDLHVAGAECLARLVQGTVPESSGAQRALDALAAWDFTAGDGEGASYFFEIERRLAAAVFCPDFPASATRICAAVREPGLWGREELRATVESCLRDADESRRVRTRRQEDAWRWEVLHTVSFRHPLGRFFFLRPLFERGPFSIHGGGSCLLDSGAAPGAGFKATRLAAYKMVLDFSDFAHSLLVYPGGQSGHPLSPSFDDQLAPYLSQKYLKMEAGNRRTYTLRLLPAAAAGER